MSKCKLWPNERKSLTQLKFSTYSMSIGVTVRRKKRQPAGGESVNSLAKEIKENNKSLSECKMK